MNSLAALLKSVDRGWLKNILGGAGLALGSAGLSMIFISQFIERFRSNVNSIPHDVLSIAHIAGFDYGISIVLGAIVAKAAQGAGNLTLRQK